MSVRLLYARADSGFPVFSYFAVLLCAVGIENFPSADFCEKSALCLRYYRCTARV